MKTIALCICVFSIGICLAQKSTLTLTNLETNTERVIKENKRIQILTKNDIKVRGRFKIVNDQTLRIKDQLYKLDDILVIRRSRQLNILMTVVNLVWIGGWSVVVGVLGVIPIYLSLVITGATVYTILDPPNYKTAYDKSDNWKFELTISSSERQNPGTKKLE